MGVVFINTRQKKKTCIGKVQIRICYMRLLHRDFPTAAPTGKTDALQEEVYKASAFRSDCPRYVPMLISARFTKILPTRLPLPIGALLSRLPPRHEVSPLAVMASSVSRMLPGQGYSIVTVIRRKGLHCSVLYRYPDMKQKKCSCPRKKFLDFFGQQKSPSDFSLRRAGKGCIQLSESAQKSTSAFLIFSMRFVTALCVL